MRAAESDEAGQLRQPPFGSGGVANPQRDEEESASQALAAQRAVNGARRDLDALTSELEGEAIGSTSDGVASFSIVPVRN